MQLYRSEDFGKNGNLLERLLIVTSFAYTATPLIHTKPRGYRTNLRLITNDVSGGTKGYRFNYAIAREGIATFGIVQIPSSFEF